MKKLGLILLMACVLLSATFGATSALVNGAVSAVKDDASYVMDVLDWDKASFGKFFGFTSINSTSTLNFLGAQHLKGGNLAYSYNGNLWGEGVVDTYSAFYGKGNKGFLFSLGTNSSDSWTVNGNVLEDYKYITPNFTFGIETSDKLSFIAGFGLISRTGNSEQELLGNKILTKGSEMIPSLDLGAYYTIKDTNKLFARAGLIYSGDFDSTKIATYLNGAEESVVKVSANSNTLTLRGTLEYKPTDRFTYGLRVNFPQITFGNEKDADGNETKDPTVMSFSMSNGFIAEVAPDRFFVSMGINTYLPSLTFEKDQDMEKGTIRNYYYMGMAFCLTPQVRIDGYTSIEPVDGISLQTVWETKMALTVSIKM